MRGPYVLTKYCVDMVVPPGKLGVFALSNAKDTIDVLQRAERNACEEIKGYFNQYKYFWVEMAHSPKEAYFIQCELHHSRFAKPTTHREHPKPPPDSGWRCPVCNS